MAMEDKHGGSPFLSAKAKAQAKAKAKAMTKAKAKTTAADLP